MCKIVTNACFIVKVVNELLFSFYKKKNQPPKKQKLKVHTLWVIYKVNVTTLGRLPTWFFLFVQFLCDEVGDWGVFLVQ